MKIYIILRADYCEWSSEYGFAKPVEIKFRKAHAEDAVNYLNGENPSGQYYYEEMDLSLKLIPSITSDQFRALNDVDVFNQGEQLNELIIMERIRQIHDLESEISKLKQSVAYEKTRANRAESIRAKTEQELRTVRNTIRAAKKLDKPEFLGFEDKDGNFYPTDPHNKNHAFLILNDENGGSKFSFPISYFRNKVGELKPVYAAKKAE